MHQYINLRVCQIACHACLRASVVYVPTCSRTSVVYVPMCLHANVPKAGQILIYTCQRPNKRANMPYGVPMFKLDVPTCQTVCQFFNLACQRAKRRANFSNISFTKISILYYYIKKFYILLDIKLLDIICICIVNKKCIIHIIFMYYMCGIFLFRYFFRFCSLVRN